MCEFTVVVTGEVTDANLQQIENYFGPCNTEISPEGDTSYLQVVCLLDPGEEAPTSGYITDCCEEIFGNQPWYLEEVADS